MDKNSYKILQFVPFSSFVNPSFWHKFTQIKLNIDKLDDKTKPIWGYYSNILSPNSICMIDVDSTSFNLNFQTLANVLPGYGELLNKNTVEQFKDEDKISIINNYGSKLWTEIVSGNVIDNPSLFVKFIVLSFADLKKYKFFYWFGFPTPQNLILNVTGNPTPIEQEFNLNQITSLYHSYDLTDSYNKSFFFVYLDDNNLKIFTVKELIKRENDVNGNLDDFDLNKFYFAFADNSNNDYPGWHLRNYLLFLLYYCPVLYGKILKVLSFRIKHERNNIHCKSSLIFNVCVPKYEKKFIEIIFPNGIQDGWSGWEKNERGKFGPRIVNMGSTMDPIRLAENSADLNLKLMKWRLLPNLDLEILNATKCLILGAGTLGCSVARSLLAWGIRHITFVDNGKVSYSNPVRQNLYFHSDCLKGGKDKALAAAENLKLIFPGVESSGHVLKIPMPGHSVGESLLKETRDHVEKLSNLISTHDIIFLLMDSRESRWLPTVLGCHHEKIVLNAALGFDTYLVMRHGFHNQKEDDNQSAIGESKNILTTIPGYKLGCYFCNDITAPGNSVKDRTLDQQCTVTRPGISAIAGSLIVELMVSILQHKDGPNACAYLKTVEEMDNEELDESLLGIVPHSIRGFLSTFSSVLPATPKYEKCIACSSYVLNEYKKQGFEFLLNVFNSAKILEDLTGLSNIENETDLNEIWEMSESDDEIE